MTCDMENMVRGENYLKMSALMVWDLWCLEDWEEKGDSINLVLINDKAVRRTALATPGLLKMLSVLKPFFGKSKKSLLKNCIKRYVFIYSLLLKGKVVTLNNVNWNNWSLFCSCFPHKKNPFQRGQTDHKKCKKLFFTSPLIAFDMIRNVLLNLKTVKNKLSVESVNSNHTKSVSVSAPCQTWDHIKNKYLGCFTEKPVFPLGRVQKSWHWLVDKTTPTFTGGYTEYWLQKSDKKASPII